MKMKPVLLMLSLLVLLLGCQKESTIVPDIKLENLFEIKEDTTNPVHQRIFKIYQKYQVPVFFNDTIGQVYIMDDVQGKPIYQIEKIDLAWTFTGYANHTYQFEYMQDEAQKMKSLDLVEHYLEGVGPSLRPFSFFITQSGRRLDKGKVVEEYKNGSFAIGYRTVYMTGNWTDIQLDELPDIMKRQMVLNKIANYPEDVAEFSSVSKTTWYGGLRWNELDKSIAITWRDGDALYEDWVGAKWYTEEELHAMRVNARKVFGKYGFVKGNQSTKGLETPQNATNDLHNFVQEMLKYNPEEFMQLWGMHPLVVKKFNILKNVIENKMKVQL